MAKLLLAVFDFLYASLQVFIGGICLGVAVCYFKNEKYYRFGWYVFLALVFALNLLRISLGGN